MGEVDIKRRASFIIFFGFVRTRIKFLCYLVRPSVVFVRRDRFLIIVSTIKSRSASKINLRRSDKGRRMLAYKHVGGFWDCV
jgi:hypothetical protein